MSKLSSKHQVTIPVRVLREAGLTAGDEIVIRASAPGRIELERADDLADRYIAAADQLREPLVALSGQRDRELTVAQVHDPYVACRAGMQCRYRARRRRGEQQRSQRDQAQRPD